MSRSDSELSTVNDLAEQLPKYCDFFKHLLVEELVLEPDYRQLHYGKCAIIGRLCAVPDYFKLENVAVPHLKSDYKLPTGTLSLLLLNFHYESIGHQNLAHGHYCIARGEIVLCNIEKRNSAPLTIRGLHQHILLLNKVEQIKYLEEVHRIYKPALNVWHTQRIDRADELIQRRLEIRVLCRPNNTDT